MSARATETGGGGASMTRQQRREKLGVREKQLARRRREWRRSVIAVKVPPRAR